MLEEGSKEQIYTLPPVQTAAEYEADSNSVTAWLLKTCLVGQLGVILACANGWRGEWKLILALFVGAAVGLFVPNPARWIIGTGKRQDKQRQALLWTMLAAHMIALLVVGAYLHPGD